MKPSVRSPRWGPILGSLALVVVVAALALVYALNDPTKPSSPGEKTVSVVVTLADGSADTFTYHTDAAYLGELLQETALANGPEEEFGMFIQTVNGVTADPGRREWWCVTKNGGETVMTSADTTPLTDGDQFELTLTVGY